MKKTGEILRKARTDKGLSVQEIAVSLKINSKIVSAIEDGDLANLPAKTFLRGFVQSYAGYLKLNPEDVLRTFSEEMGSTMPQPSKSSTTGADEASTSGAASSLPSAAASAITDRPSDDLAPISSRGSHTRTIIYSVISIVLILMIVGVKRVIERYQKESVTQEVQVEAPLPESIPPLDPVAPTPLLDAPMSTPMASTNDLTKNAPLSQTSAAETTKPVETKPAEPTPTETKPVEAKVVETKPIEAKPTETKPTETKPPESKPEEKPVEKPVAETPKEKPAAKSLELMVEALDQVDVEYRDNSGNVQKMKLAPDQVHTIRSKNGLKLTVSNGGAVNLILNGKDLGVPGDLGKPIQLNY